ncbi:MAG: hypothetical protein KAW12_15360 [Candidatus Aminicenantes bacterium]|nr:hypothetical protein [Candidatus Aminicenantes bacterium]
MLRVNMLLAAGSSSRGAALAFAKDSNIPFTSAMIKAAEIPLPDTSAMTNPNRPGAAAERRKLPL